MKASLLISLTLIAGIGHSIQASALTSDRDQPAQIEADDTVIDFKTGVRTLTNNVLVVQGTLRLKADKLVTNYNKQGELVKAVADGSLARFKQRPDGQPDDVEGWAKKILVDYPTNTITLIGKAALKQGASTATGNKIVYNMATDKLRIMGNSNVNTAGKKGTVKPKKKIEDPFKDDAQGPDTATKSEAIKATSDTTTAKETDATTQPSEPVSVPVKSGRSRLILKPRKKQ
jgi:lipopolysaccharide export system protein LptA